MDLVSSDILNRDIIRFDKFSEVLEPYSWTEYEILPGLKISEKIDTTDFKEGSYKIHFIMEYCGGFGNLKHYCCGYPFKEYFNTEELNKLVNYIKNNTDNELIPFLENMKYYWRPERWGFHKETDNGTLDLFFSSGSIGFSKPSIVLNLWEYQGVHNRNNIIKKVNEIGESLADLFCYPKMYLNEENERVIIPFIPHPLKKDAKKLFEQSKKMRTRLLDFEEKMKLVLQNS